MGTETKLLQGQVSEDPEGQKMDVEGLLVGLLQSLLKEQSAGQSANSAAERELIQR
jgi:hypothetical protein